MPQPLLIYFVCLASDSGSAQVALDQPAVLQAYKLSARLKDVPFEQIWSSPLLQAEQLAEIIGSSSTFSRAVPIQLDEAWCRYDRLEVEDGDLDRERGLELDQLVKVFNTSRLRTAARTTSWLRALLSESLVHPPSHPSGASDDIAPEMVMGEKAILVVTHPSVLCRFFDSLLHPPNGQPIDVDTFELAPLREGCISTLRIWWDVDDALRGWRGRGRMETVADTAHLDRYD